MKALVSRCAALAAALAPCVAAAAAVTIDHDEAKHQIAIAVDGKTAIVYSHEPDHFLPYFHPVNSPSGKELTVKLTKPYPHHRSFWFTDKVQLKGQKVTDFYNAYYSYKGGKGHHIRHDKVLEATASGERANLRLRLIWEIDADTSVLEETRDIAFLALGDGEYFIDIRFTVTAAYGDVDFVSDGTHYAWPYVRMHPQFSVQKGGTLINSEGGENQKGTHNREARWCDYTNTIEGVTEGLGFFSHSENAQPHRWLTRDYGCFGPRRIDARSGKRFTVAKGESLTRRIGILVHKGDAEAGKVAERYREYTEGKLGLLPAVSR